MHLVWEARRTLFEPHVAVLTRDALPVPRYFVCSCRCSRECVREMDLRALELVPLGIGKLGHCAVGRVSK